MTAALTAILILLQSQFSIPVSPGVWASILAVSGWNVVWFADVYSTGRIGDMRLEFDRRGLGFHWEEKNLLLPPYPTWCDLIFNWTNVFSLFLCVCFFFVPLLVIIPIFFRGAIFLGNWRGLLRLKLALKKFDNEAGNRGVAGR